VSSDWLVVATNVPVNDRVILQTKKAAYRSYVVALEVPAGSVPVALYWDTLDPYHYVRVERGGEGRPDVLIVGGEDHRTGDELHSEVRWDRLEAWAREWFPMAQRVVRRWSGQIIEPVDGLAFIGRNPSDAPNVLIATGDSGHGLTHGTIAASMFASIIAGRTTMYEALYSPRRISLRSLPTFAQENGATAAHYLDWVRTGDAKDESDIPIGEGATVRLGGQPVAVYREASGRCRRFSAACPHLGGVVHWNSAEKTWDCPCHGSRFDVSGHVVNGPALGGMHEIVQSSPARDPIGAS
jgi:Rieske Fe-S protein